MKTKKELEKKIGALEKEKLNIWSGVLANSLTLVKYSKIMCFNSERKN